MAIPKGLKVGDTYTEESVDGKVFLSKIIGFDGQGRYLSEFLGMVKPGEKITKEVVKEPEVTEEITEEVVTPIEQMLAEETPKKAPARKPATRKRSTRRK